MTKLKELSPRILAYHCQRETKRFWDGLPHDTRYCHALFCCALTDPQTSESKQAWTFIHKTYHRQVTLWVKKHRLFPSTGEEPDVLAEKALEKMWLAFAHEPDKLNRFPKDPNTCLKKLLRYLQVCVDSIIKDALPSPLILPLSDSLPHRDAYTVEHETTWVCIHERLQDEKERLVMDATFVYNLKPRQIYATYADRFENVKEIYRIKENVLARFKRDKSLRDCLENVFDFREA